MGGLGPSGPPLLVVETAPPEMVVIGAGVLEVSLRSICSKRQRTLIFDDQDCGRCKGNQQNGDDDEESRSQTHESTRRVNPIPSTVWMSFGSAWSISCADS